MLAAIIVSACSSNPKEALDSLERLPVDVPAETWLEAAGVAIEASPSLDRARLEASLTDAVRRHPAPVVRAAAIRGLGDLAVDERLSPAASDALLERLDDPAPGVRIAALEVTMIAAPERALDRWAKFLQDSRRADERIVALRSLERSALGRDVLTRAPLLEAVVRSTEDLEPGVRFHARRLLATADSTTAPEADWTQWYRERLGRGAGR